MNESLELVVWQLILYQKQMHLKQKYNLFWFWGCRLRHTTCNIYHLDKNLTKHQQDSEYLNTSVKFYYFGYIVSALEKVSSRL